MWGLATAAVTEVSGSDGEQQGGAAVQQPVPEAVAVAPPAAPALVGGAAAGPRGGPAASRLASAGTGWGLALLRPAWLWPPCAGAGPLPARFLHGRRCPGGTGCSCRCGGGNWLSLVCNSVHGNGAMTPARPHPGPRPRPRGLGLTLGRCCWLCWLLVSLVLAVAVLIHACWRRREDTAPALRPERTPRRRRRRRGRR